MFQCLQQLERLAEKNEDKKYIFEQIWIKKACKVRIHVLK